MLTAKADLICDDIYDLCLYRMEKLSRPLYRYRTKRQRNPNAQVVLVPNDLWISQRSTLMGLSERRMYERTLLRHPGLTRTR